VLSLRVRFGDRGGWWLLAFSLAVLLGPVSSLGPPPPLGKCRTRLTRVLHHLRREGPPTEGEDLRERVDVTVNMQDVVAVPLECRRRSSGPPSS